LILLNALFSLEPTLVPKEARVCSPTKRYKMILNNIKPFNDTGIIFKNVLDSVYGTVTSVFSENIAQPFTLGYRQSLDG